MYWWILLVGLIITTVITAIVAAKTYNAGPFVVSATAGIAAVILLTFAICFSITIPADIRVFEEQKAYTESHIPANEIEDAALTNSKVELNQWLYNAQYYAEKWGGWTFYPQSVLELEPIE